jgi:hypothetical protein
MSQAISIEGWTVPPPDDVLEDFVGSVFNVCVGGSIGPEPTPFGEFFRFARVINVAQSAPTDPDHRCARCDSPARYCFTVEWEAGYKCPKGNSLCEHCVDGVVTAGAESIPFGSEASSEDGYTVNVTYDLTQFKSDA